MSQLNNSEEAISADMPSETSSTAGLEPTLNQTAPSVAVSVFSQNLAETWPDRPYSSAPRASTRLSNTTSATTAVDGHSALFPNSYPGLETSLNRKGRTTDLTKPTTTKTRVDCLSTGNKHSVSDAIV
ncbi:hypothetical protein RF11_15939 [Thelohanellus kitauei]|uniref:Uncharacterized protein n=1 Tax=Thelohanellus kitauei TaxID=669202 RepID=A0A0C2MQ54_THEKT|nr:hypothetical protein RF11_15939 [Thelohanellus kitauei]